MKIIADTSPLIGLAIIDKLDLLTQLFDEVQIPQAVYAEISQVDKPHAQTLSQLLSPYVQPVQNQLAVRLLQNEVDLGEAEAIVLALERNISDILIDDAKGRRVARSQGLHPIGTIGLLIQAKRAVLIPHLKPHLDTLIANQIRISPRLYQQALQLAGEAE